VHTADSIGFVNRHRELAFLAAQALPSKPALVVLYGRRRTGKTALLRTFAAQRRAVLFVADVATRADQLAAFSREVFGALGEDALVGTAFPTWEAALRFVADRARTHPLLVVLDEFSYLCESDGSLPSVIQRLWDKDFRGTALHLVLCGSHVSFMERELLGSRNPLFGRRTGDWCLEPLRFADARAFFPTHSVDAQVELFAVLGGIPAYLERFDAARTLADNVVEEILTRGRPLYDEPRFLLLQEVRDPHTYFSICRAIATGRTTPNEIAQGAGLSDRGAGSRYLQTLRDLRIVERRVPATERNPERTRRGHYRLADPFLRFWFRFVLSELSTLEGGGDPRTVYEQRIAPHLDDCVAMAFEEVCVQHLQDLNAVGALDVRYDRIGGWWGPHAEVDVLGCTDAGDVLLGECKWSRRAVGTDVLDALVARTRAIARDLGHAPRSVAYALWSRCGYTAGLRARAAKEGVRLFGPADLAARQRG